MPAMMLKKLFQLPALDDFPGSFVHRAKSVSHELRDLWERTSRDAAANRKVDWVNIPTLDTAEDAFYAPLANLGIGDARVYLGAIHNMATLKTRLAVARKYLPAFGLAAYCGFGRTPPAELPGILRDHLGALEIAGLH